MKSTYILRTRLIFAECLFLASCALQNNTTQPPVTALSTSPSVNASTLISVTSFPTDKPTEVPTLTPVPTLSEQDGLETFVNLIEKDDKCKLPCWLGVVPGQTDFDEVVNKFSQFSAIARTGLSSGLSSQWVVIRVFFPNFEAATHDIDTIVAPAENGKVSRILVAASTYQDKNGPLDYNNPEFQRLLQRYFVPGIFIRHGPPEKIFLDTTLIAADTSGPYPFVLWVVYPQQGFLMRYQGLNSKIGDTIRICPMQSRIEIKIWDIKILSYEEFIKGDRALGISTSLGPQPIESVTDYDVESFYETFKSGRVDTCFETPASIWPPN